MSTTQKDLSMIKVQDNATGEIFEVLGCMIRDILSVKTRSGRARYSKCSNKKVYGK